MKILKSMKLRVIFLIASISSLSITAQTVDIVSNVDVSPPLSVGQTFNYTIQAVAGTTTYRGAQIYLNYNPAVLQINSLTPDNSVLNVPLANDTSVPGVIRYAAGAFTAITGTTTLFTAVFEVVGTNEDVMIIHDLAANGNPNGTGVANSDGQDITGTANPIILATLAVDQNNFSDGFSIYPNPVRDVLYLKTNDSSEIETIKMYSVDGKLVHKMANINNWGNQIEIPVSQLEEALYFVTITSVNKEHATFKILIN